MHLRSFSRLTVYFFSFGDPSHPPLLRKSRSDVSRHDGCWSLEPSNRHRFSERRRTALHRPRRQHVVGIPGQCLCAEAESVVKDNRGMACERDIARFNGDHVVFWTSQRFAHCLALRWYYAGDNENANKAEFDYKPPGGCRWQRAILDAC